jgi:putative DNA primase/helicase
MTATDNNAGADTLRYLKALDPNATGFTWQTFPERKDGDQSLAAVFHGTIGQHKQLNGNPKLGTIQRAYGLGSGVWITVNETNGQGRTGAHIIRVRAVWCEWDGGETSPKFPLDPSLVVETSPGHFHYYWFTADGWPADKAGRADFEGVMACMVATYGSDKNAKDLSRVLRVPGTKHRKDPDKPFMVRIVGGNEKRYARAAIIAAFPRRAAAERSQEQPSGYTGEPTDWAKLERALNLIPAHDRDVWRDVLFALHGDTDDPKRARTLAHIWSTTSREKYDPDDLERVWKSIKDNKERNISLGTIYHLAQHAENTTPYGFTADDDDNERSTAERSLETRRMSDVEPEAIDWFWPQRFALGKLGILGGLPGKGKGTLLSYLIACTTAGTPLPNGEGHTPRGNVLVLSAEDAPGDTIKPRLTAAGADCSKVHVVSMVRDTTGNKVRFNLGADLDLLRQEIKRIGDVKLVTIDPVSSYIGGKVNNWSGAAVRDVLDPLADLAAELDVCVIAVMHFNKKTDVTSALLRLSDSSAYGAAARHVYVTLDDPDNRDGYLLAKAKNNHAPKDQKSIRFTIEGATVGQDKRTGKDIEATLIVWGEGISMSAEDAMTQSNQQTTDNRAKPRHAAQAFLLRLLSDGPVKSDIIRQEATEAGIDQRTLYRAAGNLRVIKTHGHGSTWAMPEPVTIGSDTIPESLWGPGGRAELSKAPEGSV